MAKRLSFFLYMRYLLMQATGHCRAQRVPRNSAGVAVGTRTSNSGERHWRQKSRGEDGVRDPSSSASSICSRLLQRPSPLVQLPLSRYSTIVKLLRHLRILLKITSLLPQPIYRSTSAYIPTKGFRNYVSPRSRRTVMQGSLNRQGLLIQRLGQPDLVLAPPAIQLIRQTVEIPETVFKGQKWRGET